MSNVQGLRFLTLSAVPYYPFYPGEKKKQMIHRHRMAVGVQWMRAGLFGKRKCLYRRLGDGGWELRGEAVASEPIALSIEVRMIQGP